MSHSDDGRLLEKQIYKKRKGSEFTEETLIKVLNSEIQGHLIKFPHLQFASVDKGVENSLGIKYTLQFTPKPKENATSSES